MGELNRDSIDRQIEEDDRSPLNDTRVPTLQGQEEHPPAGRLGEVYVLLGKGLSLGQISNELRIKERELRYLLAKGNQE
jgi:hypothetical protein